MALLFIWAKIETLLEKLLDHFECDQRAKQYKVIIIDNTVLTAQFKPAKIETLLNDHARAGWSVKGMVEFDPPSFTGNGRAIIVVMGTIRPFVAECPFGPAKAARRRSNRGRHSGAGR